jgi:putative toxin-antitoxin system antitoxin component (TIGR02293 family)
VPSAYSIGVVVFVVMPKISSGSVLLLLLVVSSVRANSSQDRVKPNSAMPTTPGAIGVGHWRRQLALRQYAAYFGSTLPRSCKDTQMPIAIVEEVARKLGGHTILGTVVRSQADLALAVRNRLPLAALKGLTQAGLTEQEIERFVIPQRTRRHRADRNQPLTVDESDRAVRLLRVQTLAEETFGDKDKANRWLRRKLTELHGESPLVIAQTEAGARVIETILGKIAWGAAA